MISVGKYPAKSGQGEFTIGYSVGNRVYAQDAGFVGISSCAPPPKRFTTKLSGRIRPNPASANVVGQDCSAAASTLNSHLNFSAAQSALAANRSNPAINVYGR